MEWYDKYIKPDYHAHYECYEFTEDNVFYGFSNGTQDYRGYDSKQTIHPTRQSYKLKKHYFGSAASEVKEIVFLIIAFYRWRLICMEYAGWASWCSVYYDVHIVNIPVGIVYLDVL